MRLLLAIILTLGLAGCASVSTSSRFVLVEFVLPDLSPEDVERRVAVPVENAVATWPEVHKLRSRSSLGAYAIETEVKQNFGEDLSRQLVAEVMKAAKNSGLVVGTYRTRKASRTVID